MKNNVINLKRQTRKMEEGFNIKKILMITGLIAVSCILFFMFKSDKKEYDYDNLVVYYNNNPIELTSNDKETIAAYLSRSEFKKIENTCEITKRYIIKFDSIELSFSNDNCGVLFKNAYTEENYSTDLEDELKEYIIGLSK